MTFEQYLIMVGIRSVEFEIPDNILFEHIEYFRKCHSDGISAYKALTLLTIKKENHEQH